MKLIDYLEVTSEKIVGKVDIDNGEYNIKINYIPIGEKVEKKINFKIATNATVRQLSEMIKKTDPNLSISANDPHYKNNKNLYDIFLANDPEFNVSLDKNGNYKIRMINMIQN
jgi:hypothetical protein